MTHKELVERAEKWLRGTMQCSVVMTEAQTRSYEIPDAIGWVSNRVILVECKTSRSDFQKDRKKPHRILPGRGVGTHRYYFTPPKLVAVDELPERWGLAECHPKRVRKVLDAERFLERNTHSETSALLWWIRKLEGYYE